MVAAISYIMSTLGDWLFDVYDSVLKLKISWSFHKVKDCLESHRKTGTIKRAQVAYLRALQVLE